MENMKQRITKGKDDCMAIGKQALKTDYHAKLVINDLDGMGKKEIRRLWVWLDDIVAQIIDKKKDSYVKKATWRLMK